MWEHLYLPLCETQRFPTITPDRRGFGKSECGTTKVTWDVFVQDLNTILERALAHDADFVFVAASMGCADSVLTCLSSEELRGT